MALARLEQSGDRSKMDNMLNTDKKVFKNIVQAKALIGQGKQVLDSYDKEGNRSRIKNATERTAYAKALNDQIRTFNEIAKNYEARQKDYRTNTAYKIANSIKESTDAATKYLQGLWNTVTNWAGSQLGADPIITPIAIVAGVVITSSVIAYFVSKYYEQTTVDYDKSLDVISKLGATNPELATKLANDLSKIQKDQTETGFFNQLGTGLKWGIGLGTVGAVLFGVKKFIIDKQK